MTGFLKGRISSRVSSAAPIACSRWRSAPTTAARSRCCRALRPRAQRRQRRGGQRKGGQRVAHRAQLAHQPVDDAARRPAGEQVGQRGVARALALQRGAVQGARGRFRAQQVGRADLHAGRAQRQRRGHAARVGDAAGRDHRHPHRAHHLRQQRKRALLQAQIGRQEQAAVAAGFQALRDDRVDAVRFEPERLVDGGGRSRGLRAPAARTRASSSGAGSPKWKLTTAGLNSSSTSAAAAPKGAREAPATRPARPGPARRSTAPARRARRLRPRVGRGALWQKKFRLKGRSVCAFSACSSLRSASGPSIAHGSEPSPPALHTATASALPCTPAIGAWISGQSMPNNCCRFSWHSQRQVGCGSSSSSMNGSVGLRAASSAWPSCACQ